MADYKITNDPDRCVKCGLCIAFCPCEVLEADDEGRPFAAAGAFGGGDGRRHV